LPSGFYLDTGYTQPKLAAGNGAFVAAGSDNNYSPTAYLAAWSTDGGKNWQVIDFSGGSGALFSAAYGTPGGVPTFVVAGAGGKAWMIR
jgi:hypothetical protein